MKAGSPVRLLSDQGAADYLGVSRSYVRALLARGVLHRVKLPATDNDKADARLLLIDVRDLDAWIDRLKVTTGCRTCESNATTAATGHSPRRPSTKEDHEWRVHPKD